MTVFVCPFSGFYPALDVNLGALLNVLIDDLGAVSSVVRPVSAPFASLRGSVPRSSVSGAVTFGAFCFALGAIVAGA